MLNTPIPPNNNQSEDNTFIGPKDFLEEVENLTKPNIESVISANLQIVLDTSEKLRQIKASTIKFSGPVLMQGENPVFYPNTINLIQGQAGVHKSRLAEIICAAFLKKDNCLNDLLGFNRTKLENNHTVVYVDTERNLNEQLPYALQSLQMKAGFNLEDHPDNFEYISLLQIDRKERFKTLNEYLERIRQKSKNPLFIVLDVSTDCIEDFNKTDKSMELIDLMNMAINAHNVIFLCIIHENPKSEKARGHFGTELMNKASTVMQVGFEKDANQNDTDLIRVKYLKCRSSAKHAPYYIKYSDQQKGLVLAEASEVSGIVNNRKHKASNEEMITHIEMYIGDGTEIARIELLDKLCKDFNASQRTIEARINYILKNEMEIFNSSGVSCKLSKEIKEKILYYKLIPNETE